MSKNLLNTTLSFRVSKKTKQDLLKLIQDLSVQEAHKFSLADIIKIALEKTWGIKCINEEPNE